MPQDHNRKLLFIGFIGFVAVGMPGAALGVAWATMQTTFNVSLDSIGVLLTALMVGRLLMSVNSGRFIGRLGVGNFMLAGSVVMVIGLTGFVLAPLWPMLVLTTLIFAFGVTALNTGINTHAAAHYSSGRMNWLHAWFGLGSALGPLIVTIVVIRLDLNWRWAYSVFLALQIALTAVFALTRHEWVIATEPGDSDRPRARLGETLRLVPAWFGIALFFLHGGIQVGTGQLSNSLMTASRGIDPGVAGLWISIYWAGLTTGRMFTGMVVGRVGNDRFMRISMFITIIGTLLLWSNISVNLTFAGIALIGFTLAPVLPVLLADTPKRGGMRHSPNIIGLQVAGSGIGSAVLVGLAAFVAERMGLETIGLYLFLVAVVSFLTHEGLLHHNRRNQVLATQPVAGD